MKNAILPLLLMGIVLTGCGKNNSIDDYPEENPLLAFLDSSGFSEITKSIVNSGRYEFGLQFTPRVTGVIKAVVIKIPDHATDIRVSFWAFKEQTLLRTETVPSVRAGLTQTHPIPPLLVQKDQQYMITFNSDDWYIKKRVDESPTTYPITAGNILIESYRSASGHSQTFPTLTSNVYYAGELSFVFQRTQ